jgi:hypothetical protein
MLELLNQLQLDVWQERISHVRLAYLMLSLMRVSMIVALVAVVMRVVLSLTEQ